MKLEARNFYIGTGNRIDQNSLDKYVEVWSDSVVNYGMDKAVKYQMAASPGSTFYYQ